MRMHALQLRAGARSHVRMCKCAVQAPSAQAFGTSEYARIADAGSSGTMSAVPLIRASRVQATARPSMLQLCEAADARLARAARHALAQ
eukprot:6185995-Pleurochrysis_carterae.AAC.1